MVYNNGFPETYSNGYPQNNYPQFSYNQPYYGANQAYQSQNYTIPNQANQQIQASQNQHNNAGIIWVQGEAGAKAYPVAPNNKTLLMDSENPVLYVKSVNASGIPDPLCIYDLVKREDFENNVNVVEESERFKKIEDRLSTIENKINSVNNNKQRGNRNNG